MRIAQVSPLEESVPPRSYGGTERVVSYLTEELVRQGHEVTLYASGDSRTRARLVPMCERSLRTNARCVDHTAHTVRMLERVACDADRYDVIHCHIDHLHLPLMRRLDTPGVTTLHGRLDIPDLVPLWREFDDAPVVSISDSQREPLPWLDWRATVHHGLPLDLYSPRRARRPYPFEPGYLAFLGRISPEKGIERALEIADRAGLPLVVAAKIDAKDREYFETSVRSRLRSPRVAFVGEVGEREKQELLGGALALLFPIDWPEPFGLVTIESLACGTPVIARPRGAVPEVIEHGVSGFLVESVDDAVRAVRLAGDIDRTRCRLEFERRFSVSRMARGYLRVYESLVRRGARMLGERVR
jgi:glycosyltransferase involved in cell wall biosynthesis